jgi:hypothetical protein
MVSRHHDIGSQIKSVYAFDTQAAVDSTSSVTGASIDRLSNEVFLSGKVCIHVASTMTSTGSFAVTATVQDSPTSTAWTDYAYAQQGSTVATYSTVFGTIAATAAQSVTGTMEFDVDLGAAAQYVRVNVVGDHTGSTTSRATYGGVFILGGGDFRPPQ